MHAAFVVKSYVGLQLATTVFAHRCLYKNVHLPLVRRAYVLGVAAAPRPKLVILFSTRLVWLVAFLPVSLRWVVGTPFVRQLRTHKHFRWY